MAENMEAQELWQHRRQERGGGPAGVPTLTRWAPTCSLRRNRRCPHRQLLRRPGAFAVVTTDWKRQKLLSWETGRPGCTRQGDPPHMKERGASMHFKSLSQTPPRWRTRKDKTNADGCECPLHWAWMWGWWEGHVGDPGWGQHWVWGLTGASVHAPEHASDLGPLLWGNMTSTERRESVTQQGAYVNTAAGKRQPLGFFFLQSCPFNHYWKNTFNFD